MEQKDEASDEPLEDAEKAELPILRATPKSEEDDTETAVPDTDVIEHPYILNLMRSILNR